MGKEKKIIPIFVYGTLLDQRPNCKINHVVGQMINVGSFPAVMLDKTQFGFDNKSYRIEGQVLEIESESMGRHIDSIEGIPYLYTKEKIVTEEGTEVYIYQGKSAWDSSGRQIKPDEDGIARWKGHKGRWSV